MENQSSKFLTREQTAVYLSLTTWWLEKHAHTGQAPKFMQKGRKVFYHRDDLDAWKASPQGKAAQIRVMVKTPSEESLHAAYEEEFGRGSAEQGQADKFVENLSAAGRLALFRSVQALLPQPGQ